MTDLANVVINQKQERPELHERIIEPAHSKEKLIISSQKIKCQEKEGNSMYPKNTLKKIEVFEISHHEKEILSRLNDLMNEIHPEGQDDTGYKSSCDGCENLWKQRDESYYKVQDAFRFILQQILKDKHLSHLNPLVEKIDDWTIDSLIFAETLSGQDFMSLYCVAE